MKSETQDHTSQSNLSTRWQRVFRNPVSRLGKTLRLLFLVALAVLIGAALAITLRFQFINLIEPTELFLVVAVIAMICVYVTLSRFLIPTWQAGPVAAWQSIIGIAFCVVPIIAIVSPSLKDAYPLDWQWAVGPQSGQSAPMPIGNSWGETPRQVIELHASDDAGGTQWGIWKITAIPPTMLTRLGGQMSFTLTQPDWVVIDPKTGQAVQGPDGVIIVYTIINQNGQQIVKPINLNPFIQSAQRTWISVDLSIPAGTQQINIELQKKQNNYNDRVWISPSAAKINWSNVAAPTQWLATGFLTLLILTSAWRLSRSALLIRPIDAILSVLAQYGWLVLGGVCLGIGYLLVWQRGMYMDDYSLRAIIVNVQTNELRTLIDLSQNPNYPSRILTWIVLPWLAALIPNYEIYVRLFMALCVGSNALLLGLLVYRLMGSVLAAVISGWLFLMPIFTDTIFWIGAGGYIFATLFTLTFLHASWSALTQTKFFWQWTLFGLLMFFISLLFSENCIAAIGLLIFFEAICLTRKGQLHNQIKPFQIVIVLVTPFITLIMFYLLIARNSAVVVGRSGLDFNPLIIIDHAYKYFVSLWWWTLDPTWGLRLIAEAIQSGFTEISTSWWGITVLLLANTLLTIYTCSYRPTKQEYTPTYRTGLILLCMGLTWALVAFLFPYTLAKSQMFERRYVYFPTAGLSIAFGALAWIIAKKLRSRVVSKALIGLAGIILLVTSITMTGFSKAYATRAQLDQAQLTALRQVVPSQSLPNGSFIVPLHMDERLYKTDDIMSLLVFGIFETPWAAQRALEAVYDRSDILPIVSNRWGPTVFSYEAKRLSPNQLYIQGKEAAIDKTLIFTYQQGKVAVIEHLVLIDAQGLQSIIEFPIAQQLRLQGVPVIEVTAPDTARP